MSLPDDLLAQARELVDKDRRRPRQASLRRAISTAYYSLFHLLTADAAGRISSSKMLHPLLRRAFDHGEIKKTAEAFAGGHATLPEAVRAIASTPLPAALVFVASAFRDLQVERHTADYDFRAAFERTETVSLVALAEEAHRSWRSVRRHPAAEVFLLSLLLGRRWTR